MTDPGAREQPSLEEVVQGLGEEVKHLMRAEIALAREEMTGQVRELGLSAGMLGGAALLGLLSAGSATAGLVLALARGRRPWLAAATVSAGYAGGALILAREGQRRIAEIGVPVPEQTIDTLKETAQRVAAARESAASGQASPPAQS